MSIFTTWTLGVDGSTAVGMSYEYECDGSGTVLLTPMWSDEDGVTVEVTAGEAMMTAHDVAHLYELAQAMMSCDPPVTSATGADA